MNIANKLNEILKEYSSGNKLNAYKKFKKIFLKNKENKQLRYNIALMQNELGLVIEAKQNYQYLVNNHSYFKAKINLYNIFLKEEDFEKAYKLIVSILKENPSLELQKVDKAFVLYKLNKINESIIECKSILKINNKNIQALNIWGLCCFVSKNFNEANILFLKALKINKDDIVVLNSLGRLNHEIREPKLAKKYFLQALELNSNTYQTLNNIAGFYLEEGEYNKAIKYYKKAYSINSKNNIILNNLGKAYFNLDEIETAEKYVRKALLKDKANNDFKKTLSLILLRKHDFENAWKYFDGRLGLSDFSSINNSFSLIEKKLLLKNKLDTNSHILVIREQGVGDEILYGSMYLDMLEKFKNLTIECDQRLIPLFKHSFNKKYKNRFIKLGSISTNTDKLKKYDNTIYAGSLGKFVRNKSSSFPSNAYLKNIDTYKDIELDKILKVNTKLKVGISWKSFKNRYAKEKSLTLEDFKNLFNLEKNCLFFNLQYGNIHDELNKFIKISSHKIITLKNLDLFNNLVGVANLLSKLDMFITVSNSTAHLAGALGVKTLLVKPINHASYHYWNYPDYKTPWYNSVMMINKKMLNNKKFVSNFVLN